MIGSVGPGTKLPTLGHAPYAALRDAYRDQVTGLLVGGVDAVLVETCQDLLQAKAAIVGARRAMAAAGRAVPLITHVTVETTGTMLLGSEIGAALTALAPLGIDLLGLNCATGPAEMSEHLRYLSRHSPIGLSVMPNAGLPELGPHGATYPLTPDELADGAVVVRHRVRRPAGRRLLRHHPGAHRDRRRGGPRPDAGPAAHPRRSRRSPRSTRPSRSPRTPAS